MMVFFEKSKSQRGSALVMAMIFGFIILVCVSSLTYVIKYDLLSTKSLVKSAKVEQIEEQYINQVKSKNTINLGKQKLGDYKIINSLKQSIPLFSHKNVAIALYEGVPTAISDNIIHELFYNNKHKLTKSLIFKHLPEDIMFDYGDGYTPINIPYVDIERMTRKQQYYHLNNAQKINTQKYGYIGFFEKEKNWLLLVVNNQARIISLEDTDLDDKYKLKVGWSLINGNWSMYIAVYDKSHLYIYKTKLKDLLKNTAQTTIDFSDPIEVIDPPAQIQDLTWYYTANNALPSLAIASATYNNDILSVAVTDLSYNQDKKAYVGNLKDNTGGIAKVKAEYVHIKALDPEFTLAKSALYLIVGDRFIVYNIKSDKHKIQQFTMLLDQSTSHAPIIIKKNLYSYYLLTYEEDSYSQYLYTVTNDNISKPKSTTYKDEKIQNIVVRYGLKFIVTKKYVYVVNFENKQLNKLKL